MGNPIRLVDPDGREAQESDRKKRRRARRNAKATRKYQQYIGSALRDDMTKMIRDEQPGSVDEYKSIADRLQKKADALFDKYKGTRWARFYQPKRHFKQGRHDKSKSNGTSGYHIMTLDIWKPGASETYSNDNEQNGVFNVSRGLSGDDSYVAYSFDGDYRADQLTVTTRGGATLTSGAYGLTGELGQTTNGLVSRAASGGVVNFNVVNGSGPPPGSFTGRVWTLTVTPFTINISNPLITGGENYSQ